MFNYIAAQELENKINKEKTKVRNEKNCENGLFNNVKYINLATIYYYEIVGKINLIF